MKEAVSVRELFEKIGFQTIEIQQLERENKKLEAALSESSAVAGRSLQALIDAGHSELASKIQEEAKDGKATTG
jgi:methylmalonyl-CoA mutase cobalamin-binding subunit